MPSFGTYDDIEGDDHLRDEMWEKQIIHNGDRGARQAIFAHSNFLETLCIHRPVRYESRVGQIFMRQCDEAIVHPRDLPPSYLVQKAATDRKGNFLIGIPDAFHFNSTALEAERNYCFQMSEAEWRRDDDMMPAVEWDIDIPEQGSVGQHEP